MTEISLIVTLNKQFNSTIHHCPCTTAGGQVVPEGTLRVVIVYEMPKKKREHSGWDVPHYKKISNCHASGHRHVRYGMSPTSSRSGHHQIKLYVVSDEHTLWYRYADRFIQIKPCEVKVLDVLKDHKVDTNHCTISKCKSKNVKTSGFLITDNSFSSNLTKHLFSTQLRWPVLKIR